MFKGFICEADPQAKVTPEACIACAQKGSKPGCHFTPPLLRDIAAKNQPRGLAGWSATQLTGCARKQRLKAAHDWWAKPSELYYAWRGTIAHGAVEAAHDGDHVIAEERFRARVNGTVVSGQPDVVYVDRRLIQDYKTTKRVPRPWYTYTCRECGQVMRESQWKIKAGGWYTCKGCETKHNPQQVKAALSIGPPRPYDTHVAQLSIYRWLLAENGVQVDTGEIVYLDMAEVKRLPVELWPVQRTGTWVNERVSALVAPGMPLPLAKDADDAWQCKYCPVVEACQEAER